MYFTINRAVQRVPSTVGHSYYTAISVFHYSVNVFPSRGISNMTSNEKMLIMTRVIELVRAQYRRLGFILHMDQPMLSELTL